MNMKINLVPVKNQEFDTLFSVVKQGLYSHVDTVFGWCDHFQRERLINEYDPHWFNWIYVEEMCVGMLCFKPYEDAIHVHMLVIFPEFQKRKFGEKVMKHVHEIARKQKRNQVTLSSFVCNESATKFYKSLGYQVMPDSDENFLSLAFKVDFHKPYKHIRH